jgi:opacity protein-like surface antigen
MTFVLALLLLELCMRTFTHQFATSQKARRIAFTAVILAASAGAAAATEQQPRQQPANASQYYGFYQGATDGPALSRSDRAKFDRSGTRGREGLGADAYHPEGPGNFSD